jgi:hypothetical protein
MTKPVAIVLIAGFALGACASQADIAREISDRDHLQCMDRGFESGCKRRSVNTLMRKVKQPPPAGAAGAGY